MKPGINPEYQDEDGSLNIEEVKQVFSELFCRIGDRRVMVHTNAKGILSWDDEIFIGLVLNPDVHIHGTEEDFKQIQERYERINRNRTS